MILKDEPTFSYTCFKGLHIFKLLLQFSTYIYQIIIYQYNNNDCRNKENQS